MFWIAALEILQNMIYFMAYSVIVVIYFLLVLSGGFAVEQYVTNKILKYCLFTAGGFVSFWLFMSVLYWFTSYYREGI